MNLTEKFSQREVAEIYDGLMCGNFYMGTQEYEVKAIFSTHYEDNETGRHECYNLTGVEELIKLDADGTKIEITPEIAKFIIDKLDHE